MTKSSGTNRKISTIVNTLIGSGFQLVNVTSKPSYLLFRVYRTDEFGIPQRYVFAYSDNQSLKPSAVAGLSKVATNDGAPIVVIGKVEKPNTDISVVTLDQFVGKMGGSVPTFLPLEVAYSAQLAQLGFNKKPLGLTGRTDDLFETYVHAGLQFLMQKKVIRYGQDRLFETLPDGLVLSSDSVQLLYDCKAYKDGYPLSRNAIRQFADYVRSFHQRYESYAGRIHAFLVISGKFQSNAALEVRSQELYSECQVPLVFMSAQTLGEVVTLFADSPRYRSRIDWKVVFSATMVETKTVKAQLKARKRDNVIRP